MQRCAARRRSAAATAASACAFASASPAGAPPLPAATRPSAAPSAMVAAGEAQYQEPGEAIICGRRLLVGRPAQLGVGTQRARRIAAGHAGARGGAAGAAPRGPYGQGRGVGASGEWHCGPEAQLRPDHADSQARGTEGSDRCPVLHLRRA
ncbi:MAG: hypothetical protein J3K34DRAFT_436612 [Monoraphidium minutum]|nr:MAG: hypothetical protein J3K34DRAFT_436612 [Monoraphidium minutum]